MAKSVVVGGGSNITFGLLKDLFAQLEAGEKTEGQKGLTGAQLRAFLEHRNPFERAELEKVLPYADEEVESSYGYPKGFWILSVQEQVEALLKHFPDLDASYVTELASRDLPEGAEGWAVIPKLDKVGETYHDGLAKVLEILGEHQKFKNWREGELSSKHLQLTDKTKQSYRKLNEQPGDFWVFPFQFGKRWRGRSVRRARVCFGEAEFGLGSYEVAVLLLTHPARIQEGYLNIDCGGVEYSPSADGGFFSCLGFFWHGSYGQLGLSCNGTGSTSSRWGSVSGFLSQ